MSTGQDTSCEFVVVRAVQLESVGFDSRHKLPAADSEVENKTRPGGRVSETADYCAQK